MWRVGVLWAPDRGLLVDQKYCAVDGTGGGRGLGKKVVWIEGLKKRYSQVRINEERGRIASF